MLLPSPRTQCQHKFLPLLLEGLHVALTKDTLQRLITGRILFRVGHELAIESHYQLFFLEIITEIARLGVMLVVAARSSVKLGVGRGSQFLKRNRLALFDRLFKSFKPPVDQAANVAVLLSGLLVKRRQTFI